MCMKNWWLVNTGGTTYDIMQYVGKKNDNLVNTVGSLIVDGSLYEIWWDC